MKTATYLYEAHDGDSFTKLSEYAIKTCATVTVNPDKRTILVTTDKNDGSDDDPIRILLIAIDNEGLSCHKTHVECEGDILKQIADLTKQNEILTEAHKKGEEGKQLYQNLYYKESGNTDRLKKQIAAIATLIDAIGQ